LDPVRTALLCELIKEVQERHQCSAIIVSHDIKTCFEIADYVILLHGGRVVESGTKSEVRQSPNAFTRQFLEGAAQGPLRMD
ncbi:MAG: hypothetical protein J2P32_15920, partial [Actinobacteria bacterium]|nr:hypothetical protein [Actinomycetota bacterium]